MSTQLTMPRLSQDMESGMVVEWLKQEGDPIERGEVLLVVESDKANVEVEAPEGGILLRVLAEPGSEHPIGAPLAIIGAADEAGSIDSAPGAPEGAAPAPAPSVPDSGPAAGPSAPRPQRQPASPAAKRVAAELGIDLTQVAGTGPEGLVSEADVRAFAAAPSGSVSEAADDVEIVPLSGMRKRIADRMSLSRRTVPDVTTVIDVSMDAVARVRKATGLSYTTYIAWAAAHALTDFPDLNATFVADEIRRRKTVDLGVAVAVDAGLIVVVVHGAERLAPAEMEAEIGRLAESARTGRIRPADLTGASFTVTNSGTFGSLLFTPIINVPEVAILGAGRVADVPVVRDGQVVPGKVLHLCLSYDHRVVDGATAVRFLASVKARLQDIESEGTR